MLMSDSYVSKLFAEPRKDHHIQRWRAISRESFLRTASLWKHAANFLTCTSIVFAVTWLQSYICGTTTHSQQKLLIVSAVAGMLAAFLLAKNSTYSHWPDDQNAISETADAVRMSYQALMLFLPASLLLQPDIPSRGIAIAFVLMPLWLLLQRQLFRSVMKLLHQSGDRANSAVICEAGERSRQCDLLVIPVIGLTTEQRSILVVVAKQARSRIVHLSETGSHEMQPKECIKIEELLSTRERKTIPPWGYTCGKRIIDLVASFLLLLLFSPLFLLMVVLIRLNSPGPALFVQKRVGHKGRLFKMYKFRSMSSQTPKYECSPKISSDPRITAIGRLLRKTSIDELPQLINVFFGQMSLVGPRPEMPFIVRRYTEHQRQRLQVIPGITGLWQLSTDRPYPIHENLHHDLCYIQHRTLSLDLAILFHTLFFAARGGI